MGLLKISHRNEVLAQGGTILGNEKEIKYKEAMIIGFLGVLRMRKEINLIWIIRYIWCTKYFGVNKTRINT